ARALANDPPIVVADEPTGNLDSHNADAVLELFTGLAADGKTVLMVTHERDVSRYADRVVTLVDGAIAGVSRMAARARLGAAALGWSRRGPRPRGVPQGGRVARRKVLRDLWLARGRMAVLVLAVALSLGVVAAVLGAYAILAREMPRSFLASSPASATLVLD